MKKIVLRLLLAVTLLLPGAVLGAPSAAAQDAPSGDSSVTMSGRDEFANLKVTVSQTKSLINQSVKVSWTGGVATPLTGPLQNFLQIMQCWGDPAGPDRTQCQFGRSGLQIGGAAGRTIHVPSPLNPSGLVDPVEPFQPVDPTGIQGSYVPFWPVDGTPPAGATLEASNEFFDNQSTNEVALARTRGDGTGEVDFEIQTVREAPGLGCGASVDVNGTPAGRPCWLVIVPRGSTEVDDLPPRASPGGLQSSPLSQTNWNKKIAVRLEFLPQGRACPVGTPERRLTGHELVVDAVSRWQPALCANGGTLYGFTQLSDDLVRRQLLEASDPGLVLMSNPVPPDQQPPDRPLVYAPVAASGLAFAFNIVRDPPNLINDDDPRREVRGQPFTEMKLTPRLVAKLLTQSYRGAIASKGLAVPAVPGVPAQPPRLQSNPSTLMNDPDFLDINSGYRNLVSPNDYVDALVQLGTSDLTGLLWDWVLADKDAREFVDGAQDPWGMVVNEANKGVRLPLSSYPRNDQSCVAITISKPGTGEIINVPFCTGDERPFSNDMHESGRAASRGDTLARDRAPSVRQDGSVSFGKTPRNPTVPQVIAVVDAATADRYGLPTAKLRNAAGEFVAPDAAGLRAGLDAMKPSAVLGVLQPDLTTKNAAAYPLTSLSSAVTSPSALTEVAGREYAAFLRYAVGVGQQPGQLSGQLPLGYVPLPEPLRQQALAAATIIETQAGRPTGGDPPPGVPAAAGPTGNGAATSGGSGLVGGTGSSSTSGTGQADVTAPGSAPAGTPAGAPREATPAGAVRRTPTLPAPAVGALLLALLIGGGLAAALAPVARLFGASRTETGGGDAADRTVAGRYPSWLMARLNLFARRR
ncbi:MAG: hypothetical protein ACRDRP_19145 [Pseudonocardiaceae bacterium]